MKDIEEGLSVESRSYLKLWIKALGCFLCWDQDRVLQWAQRYHDDLMDLTDQSGFFREDPLHYLLPLLVPVDLRNQLSGDELKELECRIAINIKTGVDELPTPRLVELYETLSRSCEVLMEIRELTRKGTVEGTRLSGGIDTYDWEAAKKRVEAILQDYRSRDRVPALACDLRSPDPNVREAAARTLARMGKLAAPATDELVEVVRSHHLHEKAALFAMDALAFIDDRSPEVLKVLRRAAMASQPDVRRKARYVHYRLSLDRVSWEDEPEPPPHS